MQQRRLRPEHTFAYNEEVGYRGKVPEQERARALRGDGCTMLEIANELGVSKSSVSLWTRDVEFVPRERRSSARKRGPHPQHLARLAEIEALDDEGIARIGFLGDHAFLVAGTALYAGEGSKADGTVVFANSDPRMVRFHCAWLRRFFVIDESRLRVAVYLHQGLDLDAAQCFWSGVTGVPVQQFGKSYRAVPDPSIRRAKHEHGCAYVRYSCIHTHRAIMGLVRALLSSTTIPG